MFGVGRDDWDTGERLYAGNRGDLPETEFDFGAGFATNQTELRQQHGE